MSRKSKLKTVKDMECMVADYGYLANNLGARIVKALDLKPCLVEGSTLVYATAHGKRNQESIARIVMAEINNFRKEQRL